MKNTSFFTFASALLLGGLGAQTAAAQSAYLDPNQLIGNQTTGNSTFFVTAGNGSDGASHLKLSGPNSSSQGYIGYISGWNITNSNNISHEFIVRQNGNNNLVQAMAIRQNGQVSIGQQVPSTLHNDAKLSVDGKLVSKSVYVTPPNTWADFVFEPSYKRLPLPSLEEYLQLNKHLPNIPSAKEVMTKGYSLGEMDTKLLQSVEELTLYVIELGKQNTQLQARIVELEKQASATQR